MKQSTGFLYALQPIGMNVVKVGATRNPIQRAEILASFSPVPMAFRHVLDVGSISAAYLFEADVLGWSRLSGGHAEWRNDLALIDDLFCGVAPAVDVTAEYQIPVKTPARGARNHPDDLAEKMIVPTYLQRCGLGELEARRAIGMDGYCAPTKRAIVRASEWLASNPVEVS